MEQGDILIIGAGPAGLAIAGSLSKEGIPFTIVEKSQQAGSSWRNHYDRLHLHTVKEHSSLPHLAFPEDYPTYVSRQQLVDYFDRYTQHFNIKPHYGVAIEKITKQDNSWTAHAKGGQAFPAKHIIVATGVNCIPNWPAFAGSDTFKGDIIHSRTYKEPSPFKGQQVLVVGMGNTGAEIALDLSEHGISTYLSVRSPVNIVPRDFLGNPTQKTAFTLAKLPTWLGDWIGAQVSKLAFGDLKPYGLQPSKMPPAKQLRVTGKTPVIDIGTVAQIKAGKITVKPDIKMFSENEVSFEDGSSYHFDTVILATGYKPSLDVLLDNTDGLLNKDGVPSSCIGTGDYQGLYFLGFDNYKAGGILGIIRDESKQIVEDLKGK
jgi:cation diffusion facilitator CzcD-associated flavoprotein CzcO